MIEWRRLLEQTHPDFQVIKETDEMKWISPTRKLKDQIERIPDRLGFKIGEVADYIGVKQYVLRYWESEFDGLQPKKSKNGQRIYTKKDMETVLVIKKLLHEDRFSIEGARSALKKLHKQIKLSVQADSTDNSQKSWKPKKPMRPSNQETKSSKTNRITADQDKKNSLEESARFLLESIRQTRTSLSL